MHHLLEVVAALLRAERLHDFPMIALAGRVALDGYVPVGLESPGAGGRLLIF